MDLPNHSLKEFLERVPPGGRAVVPDAGIKDNRGVLYLRRPEIESHCTVCDGQRFFAVAGNAKFLRNDEPNEDFLLYICRNCRKYSKRFAVSVSFDQEKETWLALKFGEDPAFGPPTPSRAISLIGPDRDLFLKGRRCENQGLGIAAFVYYRRVVENQKDRIFDEIIRVSQHVAPEPQLIAELEVAKGEVQFTKAVDSVKHAIPQSLLVNGHNPLLLLHSALSAGVHELGDQECLELATSVRVVLIELAERLSQALKDEAELNEAVNRLIEKRKPRGS